MKSFAILLCILGACVAETTSAIPLSPSVLSGILIMLMLLVFLAVGMNALLSINGPTTYSTVPLLVGKER